MRVEPLSLLLCDGTSKSKGGFHPPHRNNLVPWQIDIGRQLNSGRPIVRLRISTPISPSRPPMLHADVASFFSIPGRGGSYNTPPPAVSCGLAPCRPPRMARSSRASWPWRVTTFVPRPRKRLMRPLWLNCFALVPRCALQNPPFGTYSVHLSRLQRFLIAPCLKQTPLSELCSCTPRGRNVTALRLLHA